MYAGEYQLLVFTVYNSVLTRWCCCSHTDVICWIRRPSSNTATGGGYHVTSTHTGKGQCGSFSSHTGNIIEDNAISGGGG